MGPRWDYLGQTRAVLAVLGVDTSGRGGVGPRLGWRALLTTVAFVAIQTLNSVATVRGGLQEDLSARVVSFAWAFISAVSSAKMVFLQLSWRHYYGELLHFVDSWYRLETKLSATFFFIIESSQVCCWLTVIWYLSWPIFTLELPPAPYLQPWDQSHGVGWLVSFLIMTVTLFCQMFITTAIDYTIMVCGVAFRNRIDDVRKNFEKIKNDDDLLTAVKAVKHHQEIIRNIKILEIPAGPSFFMQAALTTVCACLCSYSALKQQSDEIEPLLRLSVVVISSYSIFLMHCWVGESITSASEDLHFAIYNNEWYRCSRETRRLVDLVCQNTVRPIHIPASYVIKMSFRTFHSVLQNSYQYLMVLMRITNKDQTL